MRPLAVTLGAAALALSTLGGCGEDRPRGVPVTEADDAPLPPAGPRRSAAFDTTYADSTPFADPRLDSLRLDSLRRDSLRVASVPSQAPVPAAPDFRAFWPRFRDAARANRQRAAALTLFSPSLTEAAFEAGYEVALDPPFQDAVLALTPRDFRRDGTARQATVVVGYDAAGAVVPQDEAAAEASVTLRFDLADGAYRLVGLSTAQR